MVSVIIPAYNAEKYIEKSIGSLIRQTYRQLEIILIDDGSTDNTGQIMEKIAKEDKRIRVFHQENKGVSAARNLGIRKANGEWISFLDADDWLSPTTYSFILRNYSEYDIIMWNIKNLRLNNTYYSEMRFTEPVVTANTKEEAQKIIKMNFIQEYPDGSYFNMGMRNVVNRLMKKSFIVDNNLYFNEELKNHEDFLWALITLEYANNFVSIDRTFYNRLLVSGSASRKYIPDLISNNKIAYKVMEDYLEKFHHDDEDFRNAVNQYYTGWLQKYLVLNLFHKDSTLSFNEAYKEFKKLCITEDPYRNCFSYRLKHMSKGKRMFCFLGERKHFKIICLWFWLKKERKDK